jgi:hypothetical protein
VQEGTAEAYVPLMFRGLTLFATWHCYIVVTELL